jgi:hypothetical protein
VPDSLTAIERRELDPEMDPGDRHLLNHGVRLTERYINHQTGEISRSINLLVSESMEEMSDQLMYEWDNRTLLKMFELASEREKHLIEVIEWRKQDRLSFQDHLLFVICSIFPFFNKEEESRDYACLDRHLDLELIKVRLLQMTIRLALEWELVMAKNLMEETSQSSYTSSRCPANAERSVHRAERLQPQKRLSSN